MRSKETLRFVGLGVVIGLIAGTAVGLIKGLTGFSKVPLDGAVVAIVSFILYVLWQRHKKQKQQQ